MNTLNEHDLRQIRLIEKKINQFENDKLDLFDLVCDLGGLLNTLEFVGDAWKDDFQAEINVLEIIFDSIEDGSISRWKGNYKEDIHRAISKTKNMINSLQEEYLKSSDPNILESAIASESNWLICPKCIDAWESDSVNAMVICPTCERVLHNPHSSHIQKPL